MRVSYCHWYRADGSRGSWGDEPNMARRVFTVLVSPDAAWRVVERIRRMGGGGWVFCE